MLNSIDAIGGNVGAPIEISPREFSKGATPSTFQNYFIPARETQICITLPSVRRSWQSIELTIHP